MSTRKVTMKMSLTLFAYMVGYPHKKQTPQNPPTNCEISPQISIADPSVWRSQLTTETYNIYKEVGSPSCHHRTDDTTGEEVK